MGGMMMSLTNEVTILLNDRAMISPTARSTTLPRMRNFLNSFSIGLSESLAVGLSARGKFAHGRRDWVADQHPHCGACELMWYINSGPAAK